MGMVPQRKLSVMYDAMPMTKGCRTKLDVREATMLKV